MCLRNNNTIGTIVFEVYILLLKPEKIYCSSNFFSEIIFLKTIPCLSLGAWSMSPNFQYNSWISFARISVRSQMCDVWCAACGELLKPMLHPPPTHTNTYSHTHIDTHCHWYNCTYNILYTYSKCAHVTICLWIILVIFTNMQKVAFNSSPHPHNQIVIQPCEKQIETFYFNVWQRTKVDQFSKIGQPEKLPE